MLFQLLAYGSFVGTGYALDRAGCVMAPWAPAVCLLVGLLGFGAGAVLDHHLFGIG